MTTIAELSKVKPQAHGVRCDLKYTLSDGREHFIRSVRFATTEAAQIGLDSRIEQVEASFRTKDAIEAVSLGITDAHKTASSNEIQYQYLYQGYLEEDPLLSYEKMEPVASSILALGLTNEVLAGLFGVDIALVQQVIDKWTHLDANAQKLIDYKSIKDGS